MTISFFCIWQHCSLVICDPFANTLLYTPSYGWTMVYGYFGAKEMIVFDGPLTHRGAFALLGCGHSGPSLWSTYLSHAILVAVCRAHKIMRDFWTMLHRTLNFHGQSSFHRLSRQCSQGLLRSLPSMSVNSEVLSRDNPTPCNEYQCLLCART
ncbi:hypothetical protein K461DRAFT_128723 [Myriangium duriaei CBS 260.36]|uniref:Uncharacterized protein n=1 Tax=Myriangium duriaei CBS 260.36 TaxID=1168546 RepID=A0A9P4MP60_9PEZI|nr:hypothetical protein K461DRAFT_128723 [Myriangium duriaei CBS 260.36]